MKKKEKLTKETYIDHSHDTKRQHGQRKATLCLERPVGCSNKQRNHRNDAHWKTQHNTKNYTYISSVLKKIEYIYSILARKVTSFKIETLAVNNNCFFR